MPGGHPILALPSIDVLPEIKRLAALRDSICHDQLAHNSKLVLWQGPWQNPHYLTVSPSGHLILTRRGNQLIMSSVDMRNSQRPANIDQWAVTLPEGHALRSGLACEFAWAINEKVVAIKYMPQEEAGDMDLLAAMTRFGVVPWWVPATRCRCVHDTLCARNIRRMQHATHTLHLALQQWAWQPTEIVHQHLQHPWQHLSSF